MDLLTAVRLLNATLTIGMTALDFQQRTIEVIQTAVENGDEAIPDEDWEWVIQSSDRNDRRLDLLLEENNT